MARKFAVDTRIFELFPELAVGVAVCRGIDNQGTANGIMESIKEREKEIRENFQPETLSQHQKVNPWREAYRAFGGKPKKNNSSIESLLRRALKGEGLRHINKIVDIYNFLSLKYVLPFGGEDLDKAEGDIRLTIAGASEEPVLLLGEREPRPPKEGEVIYRDDVSAICRRFNWKECDRTKFSGETKNAVLVAEGLPPASKEVIEAAVGELKELVEKHCGGSIRTAILSKENMEMEIE